MTREIEYKNICDTVAHIPCPDNKLSYIKEQFAEEIDSARRFDRIRNISELLRVLKKRDSLCVDNINPLRFIAVALQNNDVIGLIDTYNIRPLVNPVVDEHPNRNINVIPEIDADPVERVYNLICTEIGLKWKDFARAVKVPEGQIDDLEGRHKRISERVREVLRFQRTSSDERYWKINLCNGLLTARRKDLTLQVQQIFAMHELM